MAGALVAALMRDPQIAACAREAGTAAQAYVARAIRTREVRLRGGRRMTVAVGADGCMARGQATRIMIFEHVNGTYRRVLDSVTMPDTFDVSEDGSAVLLTHETIDTIFEATFVWNGKNYAFSGMQSHVYDVLLGQRRPYQVRVRFSPGAFATTLSGSVALNFGQNYVFDARAGQKVTIELTNRGRRPEIFLSYREHQLAHVESDRWSGTLPRTGTYDLIVFGLGERDATTVSPYAIRLTIR
jgi:hypothetical protein